MPWTVALSLPERCCLRSCNITRSDTVALDVICTIFGSDVLCKHLQATLCRSIGAYGLSSELAHHWADIDDLSATLLNHLWDYSLRADERCIKVQVHYSPKILCAHLCHRNSLDTSCIVHKNIQSSVLLDYFRGKLLYGTFVCNVTHIAFHIVHTTLSVFLKALVYAFLAGSVEDDLCSCVMICLDDCHSNSIAGSSHPSNLAFKRERLHVHVISSWMFFILKY